MKPTMEILARISQNSSKNKEEVFTRLYRYLLRPDIYYEAYRNLYANSGAATKGVNEDTADGFSEAKINRIIKSLETETYQPKPARRTYIQKANGKMRPLGIPTFTDKLVQEVLRLVLQAVYEPVFLNCSHGFRPNRSCHTALAQAKQEFSGAITLTMICVLSSLRLLLQKHHAACRDFDCRRTFTGHTVKPLILKHQLAAAFPEI